jgi:spore germination protein YaaH
VPDDPDSFASLQQHAHLITHLSPTWYTMGGDLSIASEAWESVIGLAAQHGIRLHPLIRNQDFDPHVAHEILKSSERRREAAERIAQLVLDYDFGGINVDFEGPFGSNRKELSDLIARVSARLRPAGKWVSVDVVAQIRPGSAYQHKRDRWAEPYDYAALGHVGDIVVIMGYDYAYEKPGPISPLWWLRQVLTFASSQIPASKLVMGLPFYGRHWTVKGKHVLHFRGLHQAEALDLLARSHAQLQRPAHDATPRFSWHDGEGEHIVHFEDEQSLAAKLKVVRAAGVAGVALWRLGEEQPSQWDVISKWL